MSRLTRAWNLKGNLAQRNARLHRLVEEHRQVKPATTCKHGNAIGLGTCLQCTADDLEAMEHWHAEQTSDCPHGNPMGQCDACDIAADLAYDADRERSAFGRRGRD